MVDGFPVGDGFLATNDDFSCGHYIVCLEKIFLMPIRGHRAMKGVFGVVGTNP